MIVRSQKRFDKQFKKLSKSIQTKVLEKIALFAQHPSDVSLRNHALHGKLQGLRAFSVTGDIRIIFEEFDGYTVVVFIDLGTHNQIYK